MRIVWPETLNLLLALLWVPLLAGYCIAGFWINVVLQIVLIAFSGGAYLFFRRKRERFEQDMVLLAGRDYGIIR